MDLFHDTFYKSAQQYPHNIALCTTEYGQELQFSYQELLNITTHWSQYLLPLNTHYNPIAIYGGKQWQMYAGILAILQTTAAYVPLNNKQPAERNCSILKQINCKILLVAAGEDPSQLLLHSQPMTVVYLGRDTPQWLHSIEQSSHHRTVNITQENPIVPCKIEPPLTNKAAFCGSHPAYILFTSGSTGVPKGIAVSHNNITGHLFNLHKLLQLNANDRVSQFFELSFDLSVHDMFSCWSTGAALYVVPNQYLLCPITYIKQHQLTVFSAVASTLSFMDKLRQLTPEQLPDLRISCFGGEKLLTSQALKWQHCAHNSRVINLYGPTECTITATSYELNLDDIPLSASVPIGKPLNNVIAVLVKDNQIVSQKNTLAELYLAGEQLVSGYWADDIKTAQSFITCSLSNTYLQRDNLSKQALTRFYKTGDMVYLDEQHNIVFHGRNDHQFKVSGHRVESAEIEAALLSFHQDISWATVKLMSKSSSAKSNHIVAFIEVAKHVIDHSQLNSKSLRKYCVEKLPLYMVPDQFILTEHLPRNLSGKVDVKQLKTLLTDA
ncbi:AMP-binding protein [Colwellia sp. D2M02]|uniref:AMP-binding protein n=1 Tax=Colwellia sp. D2M02 TaxID=2841562 RepID=UPI001C089EFC|nr:AMP-binding protein [Colwellia sp. D2M02]MBU2892533.1 AMP-binding protein [Colwellia sp. D2M02]